MPLEIITGQVVNVSTTRTQVTMFTGDSNNVRRFSDSSNAYLIGFWSLAQDPGISYIRSPRMHDNVFGIRQAMAAAGRGHYITPFPLQPLFAEDTLIIEIEANSAAGEYDLISLLIYYEELKGSMGRFIDYSTLRQNCENWFTVQHTITPASATAYTGAESIIAESDQFRADTDYAFIGFNSEVSTEVNSICLRGEDTGNLRLGQMPNPFAAPQSEPFLSWLARVSELPVIPVLDSGNKFNTFVDLATNEGTTAFKFYSNWIELSNRL